MFVLHGKQVNSKQEPNKKKPSKITIINTDKASHWYIKWGQTLLLPLKMLPSLVMSHLQEKNRAQTAQNLSQFHPEL